MSKYNQEIKRNLEGGLASLHAARESLRNGQYNAAAAEASLAAFHAATALLLNDEIAPGSDKDVLPLVQRAFVEKRRLTKEQGEKLSWLFQLGRAEEIDVATSLIQGEAEKAVQFAESFFEATKVILES